MTEPERPHDAGTAPGSEPAENPNLVEEMSAIPYEPLLPVEKKLIAWSLGLGIILLVLLGWISRTYFPAPGLRD